MVNLSKTVSVGQAGFLTGLLLSAMLTLACGAQDTSDSAIRAAAKAMPAKAVGAKPAANGVKKASVPGARPHAVQPGRAGQFNRASEAAQGGAVNNANSGAIRAYCNKTWGKINNNWEYANGRNHVILSVDLDQGGNVLNMHATSSPHNGDAEAKAQAALQRSQPLDLLPSGLPSAHLTITFDSTADPHGDSNSSGSVKLECNPNGASSASSASPAPAGDPPSASSAQQQQQQQQQPAAQQPPPQQQQAPAEQPPAQQAQAQQQQQQPQAQQQQQNPAGGAGGDPFK
jgi:hypothetical protein